MKRWWYIATEGLRFLWLCRRRAWGLPWRWLPIPPADYVRWRLDTAYGEPNEDRSYPPLRVIWRDLCIFLLWCRRMRQLRTHPR